MPVRPAAGISRALANKAGMANDLMTSIAVVTGSSRGIGRQVAIRLAEDGYDVVVHYRRHPEAADETRAAIQALGRQAWCLPADLEDPTLVETWLGAIRALERPIGVVVLSAAATAFKPADLVMAHHWERTYRVVIGALYQIVQGLVPLMPPGSSIITISGTGSTHVIPRYSVLGSAKAAQEALVRYLAVELAPRGIRVNGISPGIIATDSTLFYMQGEDGPLMEEARRLTPAGRPGTPADVAGVVSFLASPDSDFIRGQILVVDGGLTLGMPALFPGPTPERP
jgi:NAD(P)-dependent dehydrogenase (short-subunit alcohol dehydrogenase family)